MSSSDTDKRNLKIFFYPRVRGLQQVFQQIQQAHIPDAAVVVDMAWH